MENLRGGCSCGSVRFELAGDPLWVLACHCDACKKRTGSAYGVAVMVGNQTVKEFSGKTRTFTRIGDSGNKIQYDFCPDCGTTLRWHVDIVPGRQAFAGGTFDDMNLLRLTAEMYTDAALPWARIGCELARARSPDDAFRDLMVSKTKSAYAGR